MAILDELTPKYYEVLRMGVQRVNGDVVAIYDVAIRNVNGNQMGTLDPGSVLTPEEKAMMTAIYLRDEEQFEAATGLEKWVPPEE